MLDEKTRICIWEQTVEIIEHYISNIRNLSVNPNPKVEEVRAMLSSIDFAKPLSPDEAISLAATGLTNYQLHTPHPSYFGLFNPAPSAMGIVADTLVATFNPQLASWSHSPFANEVERHLIKLFGKKFGYDFDLTDGTFTSGGAEANHTALLTALTNSFPDFGAKGMRSLKAQPVFYVSAESHHSFLKAARLTGIGSNSMRVVPVNDNLQMDTKSLEKQISQDKADGFQPFMIVGTVGTTNSGVIDPLKEIAEIAQKNEIWFHADAAWGGAASLVSELCPLLNGIELANSITFDAHKWLSVPIGAGIFITRHPEVLSLTFKTNTSYMPPADESGVADPYAHSMSWARRFIGLKVFLSLLVAGWEGYETVIRHQVSMGNLLREELGKSDWKVVNKTELPVICFIDHQLSTNEQEAHLQIILERVLETGKAWISFTKLGNGQPTLRACVTNYRTSREDIKMLVELLNEARRRQNFAVSN